MELGYAPSVATPTLEAQKTTPSQCTAWSALYSSQTHFLHSQTSPVPKQALPATARLGRPQPHVAAARAAASEALLSLGTTATFGLAAAVVRAARLVESPRRGDRVLPGHADTSVAAAYMLGGTPDHVFRGLLARWDVCAPRAVRVKAAERMYKERVKTMIAALNVGGKREGRAENLAALRVCEVISDVVDGYVLRDMASGIQARDGAIAELEWELASLQRRAAAKSNDSNMEIC